MHRIINSLKKINYRMFFALLLFGLIPTVYTTVRIFLIGQLPSNYSFSIAGQLQWIHLLYEILQEALILPLFFFIGAVVSDKEKLVNRIKTGMIFTFFLYLVLSLSIFIFAKPLVIFMAQDKNIIKETVSYIRLETIGMVFSTLFKYLMVALVTIKKDKNVYIMLLIQFIITIIFDIFFVSTLSFSLKLGVNGIALSNIITNFILVIVAVYLLYYNDLNILKRSKLDISWFKDLIKKGGISGLESFVRNIAFMLMIVRMVNVVGEQGTFWVANSFIWSWLLLPVIQLGELVKANTGEEGYDAVKDKSIGYFAITAIIVIIWFVSIPLWKPFLKDIMKISNYHDVYYIIIISVGFYVLFAFNNVIDSIFYGLGKTNYMLFQSLVINITFYGTAFILYQTGAFAPNLTLIALMFALGTALDSILTMGMFVWMIKKTDLKFFNINN